MIRALSGPPGPVWSPRPCLEPQVLSGAQRPVWIPMTLSGSPGPLEPQNPVWSSRTLPGAPGPHFEAKDLSVVPGPYLEPRKHLEANDPVGSSRTSSAPSGSIWNPRTHPQAPRPTTVFSPKVAVCVSEPTGIHPASPKLVISV